jgi:hypothetical protein
MLVGWEWAREAEVLRGAVRCFVGGRRSAVAARLRRTLVLRGEKGGGLGGCGVVMVMVMS